MLLATQDTPLGGGVGCVISIGPKKQMIRAHACRCVAGVQNPEAMRDRASSHYPCESMSPERSAAKREQPIAVLVLAALPDPATSTGRDVPKEPLSGVFCSPHGYEEYHLASTSANTKLAEIRASGIFANE